MISERILAVDDDPRVIKSIKLSLEEYEIIDFANGIDALEFLKSPNEINLILLDVMIPGMDGIATLNEIKKRYPEIAVIIMTAYGSMDVAVQALRSHADDFIEKPFDVDDLRDKIREILREKAKTRRVDDEKADYVERIKRFIQRNHKSASLEVIAQQMCLSPKYVSRMFNEKCGFSFRDYKVQVKVDLAKSLLKDSSFNINEIAFKLGYQNPESFMRIFKRMTGVTPMQYRKQSRRPD